MRLMTTRTVALPAPPRRGCYSCRIPGTAVLADAVLIRAARVAPSLAVGARAHTHIPAAVPSFIDPARCAAQECPLAQEKAITTTQSVISSLLEVVPLGYATSSTQKRQYSSTAVQHTIPTPNALIGEYPGMPLRDVRSHSHEAPSSRPYARDGPHTKEMFVIRLLIDETSKHPSTRASGNTLLFGPSLHARCVRHIQAAAGS